MLVHFLPLSVVFLDVIQLLSINNEGATRAAARATLDEQQQANELADSLKKWLPAGVGLLKEGVSGDQMAKNDKLLPLHSILGDSKAESRKRREITEEVLELQKEISNALGEQVVENYPEPTGGYPVPDTPEYVPNVSEVEGFIDAAQTGKRPHKRP
ncbi:unnamed protein product [Bemisia tabaci]|uniref:Uncharacterized protein n=1 Tax=Bemisia tabaci TaxID=7038 RepID=A0AAI8UUS0_BEMTA|nr:unnamed protein product [Bemisia tabaci]